MSHYYPAPRDPFPSGRWRWSPDPHKSFSDPPYGYSGSYYPPTPAPPYPQSPYPPSMGSRRASTSSAYPSPYYPPPSFDAQPFVSPVPPPLMPGAPPPSSTPAFSMAGSPYQQTPFMTVNFSPPFAGLPMTPPPPYYRNRPISPPSSEDGSPYGYGARRRSDDAHHRRSSYDQRRSHDSERQRRSSDQEKKVRFGERNRSPPSWEVPSSERERVPDSLRMGWGAPVDSYEPSRKSPTRKEDSWSPEIVTTRPSRHRRRPSIEYVPVIRSDSFGKVDDRPAVSRSDPVVVPGGFTPVRFSPARDNREAEARPAIIVPPPPAPSDETPGFPAHHSPITVQREKLERALRSGDPKLTALVELVGFPKLLDLLHLVTDYDSVAQPYSANKKSAQQIYREGRSVHELNREMSRDSQHDQFVESRIRPFREMSGGSLAPEIPPVPLAYSIELVPSETPRIMESESNGKTRSRSEGLEPRED